MISFRLGLGQSNDILNVPFPLMKSLCFKMPWTFIRGFMHPSKPSKMQDLCLVGLTNHSLAIDGHKL
jgi:hypothetical protein